MFYVKDVNINIENKVSFFNWRLPFNAVQCLVRRRDGHKRAIILFMLVVCLADRIILSGKNVIDNYLITICFLSTKRYLRSPLKFLSASENKIDTMSIIQRVSSLSCISNNTL